MRPARPDGLLVEPPGRATLMLWLWHDSAIAGIQQAGAAADRVGSPAYRMEERPAAETGRSATVRLKRFKVPAVCSADTSRI